MKARGLTRTGSDPFSASLEPGVLNTEHDNFQEDEHQASTHHSPYTLFRNPESLIFAKMTRAQQTISIAMLLTSVRWTPQSPTPWQMSNNMQLYLAVFMELVSFPEKIQKEIVPVVWHSKVHIPVPAKRL